MTIIKQIVLVGDGVILPNTFSGGGDSNAAIFRSTDGGISFSLALRHTAENQSITLDTATGTIYSLTNWPKQLWVSIDSGSSWKPDGEMLPLPHGFLCSLELYHEASNKLPSLLATSSGPAELFRRSSIENCWKEVPHVIYSSGREFPLVLVRDRGRLVVGALTTSSQPSEDNVTLSTDGGNSWRQACLPFSIWTIGVTENPWRLWTGQFEACNEPDGRGSILVSEDLGQSWIRIPGARPRLVWQEAGVQDTVYLATDVGLVECFTH